MAIKTNKELVALLKKIQANYKTVYMWGTFGMPLSTALITQKAAQYPGYYPAASQNTLKALVGKGYFAFDCVGLIKGALWGWSGDSAKANGGATYTSNSVPDINANSMIINCKDVSSDFSKIEVGEAVWLSGHIGIYIGDGKVIESTPSWANGVQVTACGNIGSISGLYSRTWTKHGKLPYITYEKDTGDTSTGSDNSATTGAGDVTVGSTARFRGGYVYGASDSKTASGKRGESVCTVTAMASGAAHPIHLISTDGGGVHGWVNLDTIAATTKEVVTGALVKITGATYATGEKVPEWVRAVTHTVTNVSGDVALVGSPDGINSRVYLKDLSLA